MRNNNKHSSIQDKENVTIGRIICWSVIGVFVMWASTFILYFFISKSEERGQFGDMFGAVNALFSGLAFAGLILTLILQRKELTLQRDELEQTRDEFVEQNKTMKRQRFENTFFNLMSLHQHITDNLEYHCPDGADLFEAEGREVFKKFYLEKDNFNGTRGVKGYLEDKALDRLLDYNGIDVFNHYFHFFDGILNYVDTSELLEDKERYQYAVMLRNTLSDNERYLMFYYFAVCGGWHKQMAEEYALFYDVDPKRLVREDHYALFEVEAYDHIVM